MLVPQIVVSKRLRRQLKSGDIPEGIFQSSTKGNIERIRSESSDGYGESKESPTPILLTPRPSPHPSPIPSPPLSDCDSQEAKIKKVKFDLNPGGSIPSSKKSSPPSEKKKSASTNSCNLLSTSSTHTSLPSGTPAKKKIKSTAASTHSSSHSSGGSINDFSLELKHRFSGFLIVFVFVSLLLLGDQGYWSNLYRYLAPVPGTHELIDRSQRFYDDRILYTEIVTPVNGEITNSSILHWWVDGAFLSPGGHITRRNMTFTVYCDEKRLIFPNGNTMEVELQGKINLRVDLAKFGLGYMLVNGTNVAGAHEILLEVTVDPLPTDLFFPLTNYGKKLLSTTASTTFYYIPPEFIESFTRKVADVESPTENSFTPPVSSESSSASEAERPLPPSMETPPPNVVEQEVPQRESAQEILDSHVSLKQVTLRSAGGCNENIGKSTLLLTISLSERVLTFQPLSETGFGKAVIAVGEERFDLTSYIHEQTVNMPYRLLPPLDGAELPYRLKDISLRLQGVSYETKYMVQLFFCQDQFHQQSLENCIQHAFAWDASIATCV